LRIVITGGAGFVGSHLCDRWLADGHEVIAVDNFLTGRRENVSHLVGRPDFQLIEQNVSEALPIEGKVDFVFHMASPASPVDYLEHPIETMLVSSAGTKNALDLARANGAAYLLASTSECYGDPLEHPQKETYWGHVNPVGPRSVYDEAKRFAEAMTMAYNRAFGVNTHIVRIFNTYGPRMKLNDGRVVPNFIDQALRGRPITIYGEGKQTRSFCYVSDLVEGLTRLIQSGEHEPTNIGNPTELTILQFAEVIQKLIGSSCKLEFKPMPQDDPKQRKPDISKAKRVLGWEPKTGLDEGLRQTIAYFQGQAAA
jgi:dTDP-glucose 4,6-dehydratase